MGDRLIYELVKEKISFSQIISEWASLLIYMSSVRNRWQSAGPKTISNSVGPLI